MAILKSLITLLDQSKVKYEVIDHKTVYTALDKAGTLHLDPKCVVKTAVLKLDTRDYAIALIPANKNLDKAKFKKIVNKWRRGEELKAVKKIDFAREAWMKKNIKGKLGATPPFGALFYPAISGGVKIPTFVDGILLKQPKLIINAGEYNQSIKLTRAAFEKVLGKEKIKGSFSKKK